MLALFLALIVMIGIIILGGIFAEPIAVLIHRRFSGVSYEAEQFMVWGALVISAFAMGLVIMYLILIR
jgi:hypothetical protein